MKRIGHYAGLVHAEDEPPLYLAAYDPGAPMRGGTITWAPNVADAKRFESAASVMETWRTQSRFAPTRLDGKPNRPLTAFSIEPTEVKERMASLLSTAAMSSGAPCS